MFSNLKKRTRLEIDLSTRSGDYTGGYDFIPWLLHMRRVPTFAMFFNMFLGVLALKAYPENGHEIVTLIVGLIWSIGIPALIFFLLRKEFKEKKKGISS